jgi:hypothetical protein
VVWVGGTCHFLCKTLYSARGSLNEYCRSAPVAMLLTSACELSVHCKLCIVSYSVLYSTLTTSKTDSSTTDTDNRTHCQCKMPLRFQEPSKYQQQEYKMTSESIQAHKFSFSKIRTLSAAENDSLKSYKMQPVDLTLSKTDLD